METDASRRFDEVIQRDGRYPLEAYAFLHQGLTYTTKMVHGDAEPDAPRHVTGQELCDGLRRLALQRWGLLAGAVLRRWNIRRTRDFGEMVFLLVNAGLLGKQDEDRIEDFDDVYNFNRAFSSYEIRCHGERQ